MATTSREQTRSHSRIPATGSRTPIVWIVFGIAAAAALGAWAYVKTRPTPATVTRRDIIAYLHMEGQALAPPGERADVMAPYHAPVAKVYTTLGATVRRGDVLVELSHPSAETFMNEARQALQRAQSEYERARVRYGANVEAARARVKAARASVKAAPKTEEIVVPSDDPEQEPAVIQEPSGERKLAAETRSDLEWELSHAQAEMEAALAPYRQQVEFAKQLVNEALAGKKTAMVRAPIKGTVLAINARPGQMIGEDPEIPVAIIVNLYKLQVHAMTSADNASLLKTNRPVRLTFEEIPNKQFNGHIERVTTHQEEKAGGLVKQQLFVAIIHFENENGMVKPDMSAKVAFKIDEAENVLSVPNDALHTDDSGMPTVKILRNGQWIPVVVESGLSDGTYTEIKSGVKEGETVQVTPDLM